MTAPLNEPSKDKVFFYHIPKCAGMSVWNSLWEIYGFENCYQVGVKSQREAFEKMDVDKALTFKVIGGHGWLKIYKNKFGNMDTYYKVTVIRDPVKRIVSAFNFVSKLKNHPYHERASKQSLLEFANCEMANMLTRLTSGSDDVDLTIQILDNWFDKFVLLENFDGLIRDLYQREQREPPGPRHENVSQKSIFYDEVDPDVLKSIAERNSKDVELYKRLKSRLDEASC